ncbi:unnamed protein product [Ilex paraguariensis]|uniref:Uncharacterized protein n=1 Tax=Ilex paraguariensis TaxID=185542 RepID=A0ABC8TM84_9AQUA
MEFKNLKAESVVELRNYGKELLVEATCSLGFMIPVKWHKPFLAPTLAGVLYFVASLVVTSYMGTEKEKRRQSASSTSPCAHLRAAYHNCFNRWYLEKFVKGHWDKEECVSEWQKYRECLSQHMDDKYLSRLLEAECIVDFTTQAQFRRPAGASK